MPSKKTDELLKILEQKKDFNDYLTENADELISSSLSELLAEYSAKCRRCSLCELCMPKVKSSAKEYLRGLIEEAKGEIEVGP